MLITLAELRLRRIPFAVEFPPGHLEKADDEWSQAGGVRMEGVAELGNDALGEIRVAGRVTGELEFECDRCLVDFVLPVDSQFDWTYLPVSQAPTAPDRLMHKGEAEVSFYEAPAIELSEIARENLLLALPMQVLCQENCRGICTECGQDRNQGDCACRPLQEEERWSALKQFRPSKIH